MCKRKRVGRENDEKKKFENKQRKEEIIFEFFFYAFICDPLVIYLDK